MPTDRHHPAPAAGHRSAARRIGRGLGLLATGAAVLVALPVAAASATADHTEETIASVSPQTDVVSSLVKIHVPLPASAPAHPAACDWIQYERFRSIDGPTDPMQADAVAVLMPGFIEGATAFDPVARNTIREEARRGRHIEVWAIDRRSNCLEDLGVLDAAEKTGDINPAIDYYYGHQPFDGKLFAGFKKTPAVLADFGLVRTIEDYNAVLTHELPSQPWRESHVICGGHSLGGPLTELYAAWDFDGDPTTTADAGYRQCAGFMGFDTTLSGQLSGGLKSSKADLNAFSAGLMQSLRGMTVKALRAGVLPRNLDAAGIGPETMSLLEAVGMLAYREPNTNWSALLKRLPHTSTTDTFFKLSGASDLNRLLFAKDSMRDLPYSYAAALGQIMDDNGAVFGLVRSSFGFFDGVPVRNDALPRQLSAVPILGSFVAPGNLVLPQRTKANPVIGWRNYDQLGSGPAQLGLGVTSPAAEVTDIRDLSRILFEGPSNLTEDWYPFRLLLDMTLRDSRDRSGEYKAIAHPLGVTMKPRFVSIAGDGLHAKGEPYTDPHVILPGYQHLDVITAAEQQNDGQPEGSSQAFANLIDTALTH